MAREHTSIIVLACLFAWMSTCLGQSSLTNDIFARIQALEDKDHDQAILNEQYKADLQALKAVVSFQSSRLQHQETLIRGFTKKVSKLEKQITSLQKAKTVLHRTDDDEQAREAVKRDNIKNENEVKIRSTGSGRIRTSNVDNEPVLFHVVFPDNKGYTVADTIVFPGVVSNLGSGYNSTSGVFTAAKPGIYLFSLSVETVYDYNIRVAIVKNGDVLACAYADGGPSSFDQGSVTVATQLVTGDKVWARVLLGGTVFGYSETSFMGLLVIPL